MSDKPLYSAEREPDRKPGTSHLFVDADDATKVTVFDALRSAARAQRMLGLMLAGLFDPRQCITERDPEMFDDLAFRGLNWTEKALEMLEAERPRGGAA